MDEKTKLFCAFLKNFPYLCVINEETIKKSRQKWLKL